MGLIVGAHRARTWSRITAVKTSRAGLGTDTQHLADPENTDWLFPWILEGWSGAGWVPSLQLPRAQANVFHSLHVEDQRVPEGLQCSQPTNTPKQSHSLCLATR